jgi:23S rRNA (cytosine1962-C5)-methyltransferase
MEILITEKSADYELLDSGDGAKLEKYGSMILSRPDPQAIWPRLLSAEEWGKAHATYTRTETSGKWEISEGVSDTWQFSLEDLKFGLKLLPSKHLGVFPEQSVQWKWLEDKIKKEIDLGKKVSVLNLFGYTGGASMSCARAGAEVCHVDASEFVVDAAHKNLELSGLSDKKVRFIVDDVRKFVEREVKRGNKYDVILLDPPVYGKGTNGKTWKIEEDLLPLLSRLKDILSDDPTALVLNGYASVYSHLTYKNMLALITESLSGSVSSGELAIKESSGRLLSCGIFARWEKI